MFSRSDMLLMYELFNSLYEFLEMEDDFEIKYKITAPIIPPTINPISKRLFPSFKITKYCVAI